MVKRCLLKLKGEAPTGWSLCQHSPQDQGSVLAQIAELLAPKSDHSDCAGQA